jgi:hypothetical protein
MNIYTLSQYSSLFEEEGIDNLSILNEYTEQELHDIGVKRGHIKLLI